MNRVQDWPEQLAAWVEEVRARPFEWGAWDCARAANDAVRRLTGLDMLGDLAWDGARGALRQLQNEGGMVIALTARLGEPIAPAFAQRGDVVLLRADLGREVDGGPVPAIGVCIGDRAVAPMANGLGFVPMANRDGTWNATLAWKVAHG
jgi:hypothetical protein